MNPQTSPLGKALNSTHPLDSTTAGPNTVLANAVEYLRQRLGTRARERTLSRLGVAALLLAAVSLSHVHAQLAAWDFTGEGGATQSTNTTSTADVYNANLDSTNLLSRGAGAAYSAASNSFRTVGFQNNGISTTNTDYFQFSLSAASGYILSLSSIDTRVAGTSTFFPVNTQFAYSLDGTTFTLIGTAKSVTAGNTTTNTTPISFDLSSIAALQNVGDTTTVTFRYYASGSTSTGGFGFFSAASGQYGLAANGTLSAIPEPETWAIMVGGLGMLVMLRRFRRNII